MSINSPGGSYVVQGWENVPVIGHGLAPCNRFLPTGPHCSVRGAQIQSAGLLAVTRSD